MRNVQVIANVVTTFAKGGAFDESAYRRHLQRMVDAGMGLFVNSPGSGEVHSLSLDEFRRCCEIAIEIGKGRVPVFSMTPEFHDIPSTLTFARTAANAGVDEVQLFQFMGGHGMVPTRDEQLDYWHKTLDELDHPVALSLHSVAGYLASPDLVAQLCAKYENIKTVWTTGGSPVQIIALREAVPDSVSIGVGGTIARKLPEIMLGATLLSATEPNIIPNTCRSFVESYRSGDMERLLLTHERILRLEHAYDPWGRPNSRWLKMALTVLDLPAGGGDLRAPLLLPAQAEFDKMARAFEDLAVTSWERE